MNRKAVLLVLFAGILGCGFMSVVDGVWMPGYVVKSAIKLGLFLGLPLLCSLWERTIAFRSLFRVTRKGLLVALGLGVGLYALILGAYFPLSRIVDFSNIASSLTQSAGVTADNFLFVSLYISFVNSLLEEFFFRGFLFTNLKNHWNPGVAYVFSSLIFSLYHATMMLGWFSLPLFVLVLLGLAVGGVLFNVLNERYGTVWVSWIFHMFANFAINTIGFLLLNP